MSMEFPFTQSLSFGGAIKSVDKMLRLDKVTMLDVSVLTALEVVWAAVAIFLAIRFVYKFRRVMPQIHRCVERRDDQCIRILERIKSESMRKMDVTVRVNGEINIPMAIGTFKKTVLLPNRKFSDAELYYILLHEYTHFLNRDLPLKILIQIYCCVFWWNPIVFLLVKDLEQTLEIKCDLCVTEHLNREDKEDYLTTLISVIKEAGEEAEPLYGTSALMAIGSGHRMLERMRVITEGDGRRKINKVWMAVCMAVFLTTFLLSYTFVIQPYYEVPMDEVVTDRDNVMANDNNNTYVIRHGDGTYTFVAGNGVRNSISEEDALFMESQGYNIVEEEQ